MKKYKAIFFDWDGTAVLSRKAPVDDVIQSMTELLKKDVILIIISGTTYNNIAEGKLHELIPRKYLSNLYLGLGRGAYNYGFDDNGQPIIIDSILPDEKTKLVMHDICFQIHQYLLKEFDYSTDICFSRPNYCKIDLLVDADRSEHLFLQAEEILYVNNKLKEHGYEDGLKNLIQYVEKLGENNNLNLRATTDAKYLEVGLSTKSDNVNSMLENIVFNEGIKISECSFWGDEFTNINEGIRGSDGYMITELSEYADFFDVSENTSKMLPVNVKNIGKGINGFLEFLKNQACI